MESSRLEKVASVVKKECSDFFQKNSSVYFGGALISITVVRVSSDLSYARIYLSIYNTSDKAGVFKHIEDQTSVIRGTIGKSLGKQLRKVPEFRFFLDDSNDYAEKIDELLS